MSGRSYLGRCRREAIDSLRYSFLPRSAFEITHVTVVRDHVLLSLHVHFELHVEGVLGGGSEVRMLKLRMVEGEGLL